MSHAFAGNFLPFDFPGTWHWPTFDGRNKSSIRPQFLKVKNFAKICRKSYQTPELTGNCRKYTRTFKRNSQFSKIPIYIFFWHFPVDKSTKNVINMPQKATKWPKFDRKSQNHTGIFDISTVDSAFQHVLKMYQNIRHYNFTIGGTFFQNYTEVWNAYRNAWPYIKITHFCVPP